VPGYQLQTDGPAEADTVHYQWHV